LYGALALPHHLHLCTTISSEALLYLYKTIATWPPFVKGLTVDKQRLNRYNSSKTRRTKLRIRLKINPKTGVIYLPRVLVEDGFKGEVDAFGAGPVLVIVRSDADLETIRDRLESVSKDIELTPRMRRLPFLEEPPQK
jgi:hypothetical protein